MQSDKKIVLLVSGLKGSGKDTLVAYLMKTHHFVRFAFADELKDMTSQQYNVPRPFFEDSKMKESALTQYPVMCKDMFSKTIHDILMPLFVTICGEKVNLNETHLVKHREDDRILLYENHVLYWTPRALLVLEGSVKRSVNSDYWCSQFSKVKHHNLIAVSDWRYPNEFVTCKNICKTTHKVITVRIRSNSLLIATDESERALDNYPFDVVIHNDKNKGLYQFYNSIEKSLIPHLSL